METSKNSTRQLTLDELIYSQEGSPANPTHSLESERERRTNATCGPRCCALFENAPRATSWAKTFAALLVGMEGWSSRRCALTWRLVGTPYNRSYFQLQVSVLPTEEIESGLLLTPTSTEICEDPEKTQARTKDKGYNKGSKYNNLISQVVYGLLPTPIASDHVPRSKMRPSREATNRKTGYLSEMTGMLPTPTAYDWNTPRSQEAWDKAKEKHGDALQNPLKQMAAFGMLPKPVASDHQNRWPTENWKGDSDLPSVVNGQLGTRSRLSPLFVEEMMGFPRNWTASPFQSGDANPSKPTATPLSRK